MKGGRELIRIVSFNDVYEVLNGDFVSPNALSPLDKGRAMVDCLNHLGVTHVCFGNHEADLNLKELSKRVGEFRGVWLNSNMPSLFPDLTKRFDVVTTAGGVKLGLLGLVLQEPGAFRDSTFKGHTIEEILPCARKIAEELRKEKVDLVVPLTHQSLSSDVKLASEEFGFPVILGGHEHEVIVRDVNECTIVKAGCNCENVAICDLWIEKDESQGQVVIYKDTRIQDITNMEHDKEMADVLDKHLHVLSVLQNESVCVVGRDSIFSPLSSKGTRLMQTTVGSLICEACRVELGADCAMINGATIGGSRDYPSGKITYMELQAELPFPTKMVVVEMPGKVIKEAVKFSREGPVHMEKRGFLQCDPSMTIDDENNLTHVHGKRVRDEDTFNVALPRNLLAGKRRKRHKDRSFCDIKPLVAWAKENPLLLPGSEGEEDWREQKGKGRKRRKEEKEDENVFSLAFKLVLEHKASEIWLGLGNFEDLDADGSGYLDREEITMAVTRKLGKEPSEQLIDSMLEAIDIDGNGKK
ncbi:hypothetical protein GUITHDRAFT_133256 [Guillardia theta CCMP2712]|uniref:EF-hand domain-containing protein n=1 Tax=Guillardia theta (strain CCMP2712) TaxID=905079 RepID=L1JWV7_GUITC|nr:hypothetical protein GUITHDRAFT_133256 [Guillardia theta CCMP2712]EKX52827.1 hypothetical protein GUITHDRAFT_133256 [Guillardia theta CCMP2712]|eukprot:XP_005839807.1 hypothetical protein GUITHDRAFT_133256 [Guillardia theta CCMP2712]